MSVKNMVRSSLNRFGYDIMKISTAEQMRQVYGAAFSLPPNSDLGQTLSHVPPEKQAKMFKASIKYLCEPFHQAVFFGDRLLTIDKAASFLDDEKFAKSFKAVVGQHNYDQYEGTQTISWRLHTLVWAAKNAVHLPGDFVELGVFKGHMAQVVCDNANIESTGKNFLLFDSFEGYSKELSSPEDFAGNPDFFDFANRIYREKNIYESVCERFHSRPFVKVIKGFVPDALIGNLPEKIAFLHLDLNSALAEMKALEVLFDRVSPGGLIIFDDYGWKQYKKLRDTHDKFMNDRGHSILELPTGQGLVVKR